MKKDILGVGITNASGQLVLEYLISAAVKKVKKFYIVTPNPEILVYASKHRLYQELLNQAEIAIPDGIGLIWAARVLGRPLEQRITGVDLMESLCKESVKKPVNMGFLGAGPGVAKAAAECLSERYPGLRVVFANEEWNDNGYLERRERNPYPHIDILFVAFGFPKQEVWIAEHLSILPVTMAMGVGGSLDYLSGKVSRAPKVFQQLGLEWLFRLVRQPWRLKRQLSLIIFVWLILKERFSLWLSSNHI